MITTSFFQLFKIGPGPSSSHTVGPMVAAYQFRQQVQAWMNKQASHKDWQIKVELYGALAATGKGHGTHRAILAGLMGEQPETVAIERLNHFFEEANSYYRIPFEKGEITFTEAAIFYDTSIGAYRHPNTMRLLLLEAEHVVLSEVYYSVGGGFIEREGEEPISTYKLPPLPFPYSNMAELVVFLEESKMRVIDVLVANETVLTGWEEVRIYKQIAQVMEVMEASVKRGLQKEGELPGGLKVQRRAKAMMEKAGELEQKGRLADALFARLNAYALATSEENADGQMVVTAPTNGAAGIIPACLAYLKNDCKIAMRTLQEGLLVAAMVGFIIKDNASISGAELGCQAEVGSAAAMAAALFSYCYGGDIYEISSAAEIAMEHHLGMTCDPINGLVQIPCIERNANGAIKAYNAYLLASGRTSKPIISFDQVVEVMRQTGEDLSAKYKETATGGLATSFGWGNMPGS